MATYSTPPWRPVPVRTVKRTQVQLVKHSEVSYSAHSIPHPIHSATIRRNGLHGVWVVRYPTMPDAGSYSYESWDSAKDNACDTVSRRAGRDLDVFSRTQAYTMAMLRLCPYQPNRAVPRCCEGDPEIGSIWCEWHPMGKERK